MGKRVGWDLGLEDRILLRSVGQRQRHLDQKKINQLSNILQSKIIEAASTSEEINLSSVKVNGSFTEVRVWWLCNGVNDEQVCFRNKRRVLSELVGVNCPEIQFIPDRSQLIIQEMDRIFRIADYGTDYRALSNTARVLGNVETKKLDKKE
uniref:Ribosome-binding factor A n=1 Tax=Angiostrongylus cantonensis TaxID=6313 RepID=A0A0K0DD42_ANGCA